MAQFEASVTFSSTVEAVYDFLIRPANALKISPPGAEMNVIDAPEIFVVGSRFEFELGGFGPPQRFVHEITTMDAPKGFTETLVEGPLPVWVHEHIIQASSNGVVELIDRVVFEPPGGFVGFLVTEDRILDSLQSGFAHRHREMERLLEEATQ